MPYIYMAVAFYSKPLLMVKKYCKTSLKVSMWLSSLVSIQLNKSTIYLFHNILITAISTSSFRPLHLKFRCKQQ